MKRMLDVLVSALGLVVLSPFIALMALLICLDSRGPAFYGQQRIGRDGVPFTLWKFRSMHDRINEDVHRSAALEWFRGRPTGELKPDADPRVTRLGKYLRRSNLDELPQIFNVLKGEMSLVGPRPMMPYDRPNYEAWYFEREVVRPGMTGLWQVSGRHSLSAVQMMALDVRYVREWSWWLDLKILARTFPTVLSDLRPAKQEIAAPEEVPHDDANREFQTT